MEVGEGLDTIRLVGAGSGAIDYLRNNYYTHIIGP